MNRRLLAASAVLTITVGCSGGGGGGGTSGQASTASTAAATTATSTGVSSTTSGSGSTASGSTSSGTTTGTGSTGGSVLPPKTGSGGTTPIGGGTNPIGGGTGPVTSTTPTGGGTNPTGGGTNPTGGGTNPTGGGTNPTGGGTNPTGGAGFAAIAPQLQNPRGLHTATALNDGRILIVGGIDAGGGNPSYVVENEIYDPTANTFTNTSDPTLGGNPGGYMYFVDNTGTGQPEVRYEHTATVLDDGTVLICGGFGVNSTDANGNYLQTDIGDAWIFDPTSNSFYPTAGGLNTPRDQHYCVLANAGLGGASTVIVCGGCTTTFDANGNPSYTTLQSAEIYDPVGQTFTNLSTAGQDMTMPRQNGGACSSFGWPTMAGGLIFTSGPSPTYLASGCEVVDPTQPTTAFEAVPGPANDRYYCSLLGMASGNTILAGGYGASGAPVTDVEQQDVNFNWTTIGQLSTGRTMNGFATQDTSAIFAGGSLQDPSGNVTTFATADYYDETAVTVTAFNMSVSRNSTQVTPIGTSGYLVTGGFTGGTADPQGLDGTSVGTAELFTRP